MRRILRVLMALVLLSALVNAGSAASFQAGDARSEHQKIVDFWTVDRVSQAVPRDFVFNPASGRFLPAKPGNGKGRPGGGGGDGGGGSAEVTGASWPGVGDVVDTTGKVLFELGGQYWVCSASVVADPGNNTRSLVLTAAHCVYDNEGDGEWAKNWMFIPNYEAEPEELVSEGSLLPFCGGTKYGCWTAEALVVHDGFASAGGFNGNAILHDFAFAVLGDGGKSESPFLVETLGTQLVDFNDVSKNTAVHAFGYPHALPYDGTDLVYCAGGVNFDNRLFKLTYKLDCDMTGGSSGGPWGTDFTGGDGILISVNSYKYNSGGAMHGPKFNSTTEAVFVEAVSLDLSSEDANSIVAGG